MRAWLALVPLVTVASADESPAVPAAAAPTAPAAAPDSVPAGAPDAVPAGVRRALIICGHPGDAEHRTQFAETITSLRSALSERYGFDAAAVWLLWGGDDLPADKGELALPADVRGASTQESIAAAVQDLRAELHPDDALWVIALGHSHYDGRRTWFNLPGPDLHQDTFAALFDGVACRELVFWITLPASGFYIKPLSAEGRVIITATEADREVNETLFAHVLAEVLASPPVDVDLDPDQDGHRSLLDVYLTVSRVIAQRYADDMQLSTEHAQIDDNGDGRGTELQIDYLSEELGGRAGAGAPLPERLRSADGARAAGILLPGFEPPPTPPSEPDTQSAGDPATHGVPD
jgi:hypothetical protein